MFDSIRKLGLALVVMFSFGFGLAGVATAAPIAAGMAPATVQAEGDVDCEEYPDHPDCEEEDDL